MPLKNKISYKNESASFLSIKSCTRMIIVLMKQD